MPKVPCIYSYAEIGRLRTLFGAGGVDWLSANERRALERLREPSRRDAWLAGRLLAKQLLATALSLDNSSWAASNHARYGQGNSAGVFPAQPLLDVPAGKYRNMEIVSAGARPRVSIGNRRLDRSLSIAHTGRGVLVALSRKPGISLGIDLVEPGLCGPGFADAWFTPSERHWLSSGKSCGSATIWAIKEAVYKAVNRGEPFYPRSFETLAGRRGVYGCSFQRQGHTHFCQVSLWRTPQRQIAVFAWRRSLGIREACGPREKRLASKTQFGPPTAYLPLSTIPINQFNGGGT